MDAELIAWLAAVRDDPLAFVLGAFPWGRPGTVLADYPGPLEWQCEVLEYLRLGLLTPQSAMQRATASGHGIGKSALVSMILLWAMMTFPDTRGVITANTETQLKTKTWAELGQLVQPLLLRPRILHPHRHLARLQRPRTRTHLARRHDPLDQEQPAAFAGLHNQGKRLLHDLRRSLRDRRHHLGNRRGRPHRPGHPNLLAGLRQPHQATSGRFRECFEGGAHACNLELAKIDSRTVPITNRVLPRQDHRSLRRPTPTYVRIRILGQFPRQGLIEFFIASDIDEAMSMNEKSYIDAATPLALGVDVARFGANN